MRTRSYSNKSTDTLEFSERQNVFERPHYVMIALSNLFVILCTVIAVAMIVFQFIFDSAPVVGKSMCPSFNATGADTDRVYINKHATIRHGDVVVLSVDNWDDKNSKNIIKRVIGLSGDKITFEIDETTSTYYLVRNGQRLDEPYLSTYAGNEKKYAEFTLMCEHNQNAYLDEREEFVYEVPKGELFVLGDNRLDSADSAVRGSFKMDSLWGRVDYVTPTDMNLFVFFFGQFFSFGLVQYHI